MPPAATVPRRPLSGAHGAGLGQIPAGTASNRASLRKPASWG